MSEENPDLDNTLLGIARASEQHRESFGAQFVRFIMGFDVRSGSCLMFDTNHITPTIYAGSQCVARATGRERKCSHAKRDTCTYEKNIGARAVSPAEP